MNKKMIYKAIKVAILAHDGQRRKGSCMPYIVHPTECGFIAAEITDNADIIAAAILHDTLEDTDITYDYLAKNFNHNIADMVKALSENKRKELSSSITWEERKKESIKHYKKLDQGTKIILLTDKLSNLRSLDEDYKFLGEEVWEKFNMKKKERHAWYYGEIIKILSTLRLLPEYKELKELYEVIFS
ncbi:HD domain-containing protein [Lacrimispora amygdalina]|uniref:HD domain-containing protein n=1 Tax=Lacrimispora amygdalina TaxID=253257 RepID=UPI000BE43788|nr:HD domain-containing protein [Lacrimispora amygdalina]